MIIVWRNNRIAYLPIYWKYHKTLKQMTNKNNDYIAETTFMLLKIYYIILLFYFILWNTLVISIFELRHSSTPSKPPSKNINQALLKSSGKQNIKHFWTPRLWRAKTIKPHKKSSLQIFLRTFKKLNHPTAVEGLNSQTPHPHPKHPQNSSPLKKFSQINGKFWH